MSHGQNQQQSELLRLARRHVAAAAIPQAGDPSNDRIVCMVTTQSRTPVINDSAVAASSSSTSSSSSFSPASSSATVVRSSVLTPVVSESEADALAAIDALCSAHVKPSKPSSMSSAITDVATSATSAADVVPIAAAIVTSSSDSSVDVESAAVLAASALSLSLSSSTRVKQVQRPSAASSSSVSTTSITAPIAPMIPSSRIASSTAAPFLSSSASIVAAWRNELDAWAEENDEDDDEIALMKAAAMNQSPDDIDTKVENPLAVVEPEVSVPADESPLIPTSTTLVSSPAATAAISSLTSGATAIVHPLASIASSVIPSIVSSTELDRLVLQWQIEEQQMQQEEC